MIYLLIYYYVSRQNRSTSEGKEIKNMTKDKAYIYVRKSNDENQNVEHQISSCKQYCKANNLEVIDIIKDEGISAYRKDYTAREGIKEILQLSHEGKIDNLIVFESSRISRRMLEAQLLIAQLTENGTVIHSVTEGIINSKDNELSELLNSIRAFNNQSSSRQTSQRIISSKKLLAKERKWQGGQLPIGYTVDNFNRIIVNETQRQIVIDMFQHYLKYGNKSTQEMLKEKYDITIKRSLSMYLDKRIYIGYPYSQEETKDLYFKELQIISDRLFNDVQEAILKRRQKGYTSTNKSSMLLEGLLYCSCGTKYYISYDHKKDKYGNKLVYTYYRRKCSCSGKKTYGIIKTDTRVDNLILSFFEKLNKDILLEKFQKERSKYYKQLLVQEEMKINLLNNKKIALLNGEKKLEQSLLSDVGLDVIKVLSESINSLKMSINSLEKELDDIQNKIANEQQLIDRQIQLSDELLSFKGLYTQYATVEERKALVNAIIDKVIIDNGELSIKYKVSL